MKAASLSIGIAVLLQTLSAPAEQPKIEVAAATDGVFVTYGMHNIVLELKDGKFRYWFSSDAGSGEERGNPLEGTYTAEGDKLVLKHDKMIPLEKNWTARSVDGLVTLWRSDAIGMLEKGTLDLSGPGYQRFPFVGAGSIIVPVQRTAEDAWNRTTRPHPLPQDPESKAIQERINKLAEQEAAADPPSPAPKKE